MAQTVITSSFSLTAITPASRVTTRRRLDAQRKGALLDPRLSQQREAYQETTQEKLKKISKSFIYTDDIQQFNKKAPLYVILSPGFTGPSSTVLFKGTQDSPATGCFSVFFSITITTYVVSYRPVLISSLIWAITKQNPR